MRRLFPWNDSGGEDATNAAAVGPPRVGIAAAPAVVGDVCRAGGGGALSLPLGLRKSLESKGRECECMYAADFDSEFVKWNYTKQIN